MQTTGAIGDVPEIEYLRGEAHRKVSPKTQHAFVQFALCDLIRRAAGERGFAGTEWRFRLDSSKLKPTLFVPDVAYISAQRLARVPREERDEPTLAPEIAVEVRSPSENLPFLRAKIACYLEHGSLLVLDVEPDVRRITAHAESGIRTYEQSDRFSHPLVPWLAFNVSDAFEAVDRLESL